MKVKMKAYVNRLFIFVLFLVLFFTAIHPVFGNSGPTYWQGYPSSELLAIDENCPIEVESENLIFDFNGDIINDYTIKGKVTASYEMVNPTDKALSVQMAFPFVSSLNGFSVNDIDITADGKALSYDLYIGDVVNSYGSPGHRNNDVNYSFETIVGTITKQLYQAKHFSKDEKGRLYTIEVKPTTEQRINLAVDFEFDKNATRVITNGFNRYERNDRKTRIAAWCYEPEVLEIFVLGDDINFNVTAYSDGQLKEKTDLFAYQISAKETELMPYIMNYVKAHRVEMEEQQGNSLESQDFIFREDQLYNLYAAALDRMFTYNEGFCACSDLLQQNYYERVLTMVYTVDFPAHSRKNVTVSYEAAGTMDRTKTVKPVYTFDYILNPAENWSSFQGLNIEIFTPEEAPFILDSNIELIKENDSYYTASLHSLPDSDFTFSVYADEKITIFDRVYKDFENAFGYIRFFAIPAMLILAVVFVSGVLVKRLK